MSRLSHLPHFLLTLSLGLRLGLGTMSMLCFLALFELLPATVDSPAILCVPLALNAWLFRARGMFLCILSLSLALWLSFAVSNHTFLLPAAFISFLIAQCLTFVIVGLLVYSLRSALERSETERRQASRAYQELRQSHQLRDQFLLDVSHELRTPLTSVSGYLDLLHEHGAFLDEKQRALFLQYAREGCSELILKVNNVLEAVRLNAGSRNMQREPLLVAEVAREVLNHLEPQLVRDHPTHLEIEEQMAVCADRQCLRQVLRNLLSNAYKYSPYQTPVIVSATEMQLEGAAQAQQVCISVVDSGPGIPPADKERVFQKFVRLERDRAGSVHGSGLGLYISKQFVEEMGGQIWVESSGEVGAGSRFCFLLPAAASADASHSSQELQQTFQKRNTPVASPSPLLSRA